MRALRRAAHSYPRDLLAGRRPNRESESAPAPAPHCPRALLTVHTALECAAATAPVRPAPCARAPDIGRAHPGRRRGARPFTPGRRPLYCTTAAPPAPRHDPPAARELGHRQLGATTGSTPDDVSLRHGLPQCARAPR